MREERRMKGMAPFDFLTSMLLDGGSSQQSTVERSDASGIWRI